MKLEKMMSMVIDDDNNLFFNHLALRMLIKYLSIFIFTITITISFIKNFIVINLNIYINITNQ